MQQIGDDAEEAQPAREDDQLVLGPDVAEDLLLVCLVARHITIYFFSFRTCVCICEIPTNGRDILTAAAAGVEAFSEVVAMTTRGLPL